MYRPWLHPPSARSAHAPNGRGSARQTSSDAFSIAYEQLLESLGKLTNVRSLRFHDRCDEPGFNQLSYGAICTDAVSGATPRLIIDRNPQTSCPGHAYTDADAVFALIQRLNCLTSLVIKEELAFSRAPRHHLSLYQLTTLELHCSAGWQNSSWQKTCSRIVQEAEMLQNLCLMFQHNPAIHGARLEGSLEAIIEHADLLFLKKLKLVALSPLPENGRTWRPLIQLFDFKGFLVKHATMTEVKIDNIIFAHEHLLDDASAIFGTILQAANPETAFHWNVNRFHQDPRCSKQDDGNGHVCRYHCFQYCPQGHGDFQLPALDSYMAEMGVKLGEGAEQNNASCDIGSVRKLGRL